MLNMLNGVGSLVKLTPLKIRGNISGGTIVDVKVGAGKSRALGATREIWSRKWIIR